MVDRWDQMKQRVLRGSKPKLISWHNKWLGIDKNYLVDKRRMLFSAML